MSKTIAITITILVFFTVAIFAFDAISNKESAPIIPPSESATTTSATAGQSGFAAMFTIDEVAVHNNEKDCWSVVYNSVYNLTDFIELHPGGRDNIIKVCGTNGTKAFESGPHTMQTLESITKYFLGTIK